MTSSGAEAGSPPSLPAAIASLAADLPATYRAAWIRVLQTITTPDDLTASRLIAAHPGAGLGPRATLLLAAWMATDPMPAGRAVALALDSAGTRYEHDIAMGRVDVAVSGPVTDAVPVRLTASVAVDVIRAAKRTLLIVSYAAFGVHEIEREITAAANRGVRVDLVIETVVASGGLLHGSADGRATFRDLRFRPDVHLWQWAPERRVGPGGRRGAMHAKVIAADRTAAMLGSANLTDSAHSDNLEIGVVIHDPAAVGRIVDHFAALMREDANVLALLPW